MELFIFKLTIFLFILAILNVIKNGYSLIMAMKYDSEFNISNKGVFLFGISVAYIIMTLITGFSIG